MVSNKTFFQDVKAGRIYTKHDVEGHTELDTRAVLAVGKKNIVDWPARLNWLVKQQQAFNTLSSTKKQEYYTKREEAMLLSRSWVTCACGNTCSIIPRFKSGKPKNNKLFKYGVLFCEQIEQGNYTMAKFTLKNIELLSTAIIHNIKQKQNA